MSLVACESLEISFLPTLLSNDETTRSTLPYEACCSLPRRNLSLSLHHPLESDTRSLTAVPGQTHMSERRPCSSISVDIDFDRIRVMGMNINSPLH